MDIVKHTYKFTNTPKKRAKTTRIFLHCSATKEGKDYTVDNIHRWHLDRKFSGIGYQFVIYRDGTIHQGRPEDCSGAHTLNYNSTSIGICYIGGCNATTGKAKDTRTPQQKESMYHLVHYLLDKYKLKLDDVHGHYEVANKACPSFKIEQFKKEYREHFS